MLMLPSIRYPLNRRLRELWRNQMLGEFAPCARGTLALVRLSVELEISDCETVRSQQSSISEGQTPACRRVRRGTSAVDDDGHAWRFMCEVSRGASDRRRIFKNEETRVVGYSTSATLPNTKARCGAGALPPGAIYYDTNPQDTRSERSRHIHQ
jgi:hypothetical protein